MANLPTKILCDTNFLLLPIRFRVDVFNTVNEIVNDIVTFYVSSKVVEEIQLLKRDAKPSFKKELKFALEMVEKCEILEDKSELTVDDSLIHLAKKNYMVLGTTDSELRKKARKEKIKTIYLRQKRYLILDG